MVYRLCNSVSLDPGEEVSREGPCEVEDNHETIASGDPVSLGALKEKSRKKLPWAERSPSPRDQQHTWGISVHTLARSLLSEGVSKRR